MSHEDSKTSPRAWAHRVRRSPEQRKRAGPLDRFQRTHSFRSKQRKVPKLNATNEYCLLIKCMILIFNDDVRVCEDRRACRSRSRMVRPQQESREGASYKRKVLLCGDSV